MESVDRTHFIDKIREQGNLMGKKIQWKISKKQERGPTKGINKTQTPFGTVLRTVAKTPNPRKTIRRTTSNTPKGGKRKTKKNNKKYNKRK